MNNKENKHTINLIINYLSNQATEKELEELANWVNESDDNKNQFLECKRVWELTADSGNLSRFEKNKHAEWNQLLEKIMAKEKEKLRLNRGSLWHKALKVAAVFLFLASLSASFAWVVTNRKLQQMESHEVVHQVNVPLGGRSELILPDGSKVVLNAGSTLVYSGSYGLTDRDVSLEGEGYFEVETNQKMPFVVRLPDLEIQALGTIFNIKAYPGEEEIITTLVEGQVRIKGDRIDYTMEPSQKLTYVKDHRDKYSQQREESDKKPANSIPNRIDTQPGAVTSAAIKLSKNVQIPDITSWKDGMFIFKTEKLGDLAIVLERRFDVSVNIESEELRNHMFSGTFHKETLEQILEVINMSAPINYQIVEGVVNIQLDEKRRHIFEKVLYN